MIDKLAMRHRQ